MRWIPNLETAMNDCVLSVRDSSVSFGLKNPLAVTDRVSFSIKPGEFFALVGESGCGKSVTAMSILRLLPVPSAKITGEVLFENKNLLTLALSEMQKIRGTSITTIFQEPMQALNPVLTIGKQLLEVLRKDKNNRENRIKKYLHLAGLSDVERVMNAYPHELSGGMLQRVCIVMALLNKPRLIIADEPTTALDVTVQAQIMDLLKKMALETHTAVLLITHNMGLVAQYANSVAVMYAGRIVEMGPVKKVINSPLHPYTQGLLAAIPRGERGVQSIQSIPGNVPAPKDFIDTCRFSPRCAYYEKKCDIYPPKQGDQEHYAFCVKDKLEIQNAKQKTPPLN
ncbi:MAG: ABC transporter ATP-binding protein [Fibrobacter sp.]|nr:ABC transporter ATP-binding protein [Fibrobacter sp.]